MKNNNNNKKDRTMSETHTGNYTRLSECHDISLPLPPINSEELKFEMEIYARFMRHLRHVPSNRPEIKILSSIQFTADMMDIGDALVAKTLVDLGLRAPRKAFPLAFIDFVDKSLQRTSWEFGAPVTSVVVLQQFWKNIGESQVSAHAARDYAVSREGVYA